MSNDITDQISACADLLKAQGVSDELTRYFTALVPELTSKLTGDLASQWSKLVEIANENGTADDALKHFKFGYAVKVDITNPDVLKADTSLTYNEAHKVRNSIGREIDGEELPLGEAEGDE